MIKRISAGWLLALALLCVPAVNAAPIVFVATLTGPAEDPPNASPGIGTAQVIFDPVAHTMEIFANFSGLLGTTVASHIHCCTALPGEGTIGVATTTPSFPGFPLGVTSGGFHELFDTLDAGTYRAGFITASGGTVAGAEQALLQGLLQGRAYFNIHTTSFPGGEIRGFLQGSTVTPIPEPSTYALMAVGLALVGWAGTRRRAA
jgi:hypothetical protein